MQPCGQQEESGDGCHHETFAPASPVAVGERRAGSGVRNAPTAILFSNSCTSLCSSEKRRRRLADVSDSPMKGGWLVMKAASTLTSLPASIKFQLQPGFSQQRAIHKCIFET